MNSDVEQKSRYAASTRYKRLERPINFPTSLNVTSRIIENYPLHITETAYTTCRKIGRSIAERRIFYHEHYFNYLKSPTNGVTAGIGIPPNGNGRLLVSAA